MRWLVDLVREEIKYRLWSATSFPDPQLIYERQGVSGLVQYLRGLGAAGLITDILRRFGAKIVPDALPIGPWLTLHECGDDFSRLEVGHHVHIGKEIFLDLTDRVVFEDGAAIGMRSVVLTHQNGGEFPGKPTTKLFPPRQAPTIFRRGCSVGAGSIVLSGVEIGADAVIAAGMVVDRDVPPGTIYRQGPVHKNSQIPAALLDRIRAKTFLPTDSSRD